MAKKPRPPKPTPVPIPPPPVPIPPVDPPTGLYGPQPSIVCPAGAVPIPLGSSIQAATDANPPGTTFCIAAGVRAVTRPVVPKPGNVYVGQYGAILDGSGWASNADEDAAFKAHNADIDNVTIQNLVIRNMPQRGVQAAHPLAAAWQVLNCEIHDCREGVVLPSNSVARGNKIHHCRRPPGHVGGLLGGAYLCGGSYPDVVNNILWDSNEMYECGAIQKCLDATNVVWRANYIHHCDGPAIWNDGVGTGFLAEHNILENNERGVHFELSERGIVRNNTIRRSRDQGVYVSTANRLEIHHNVFEDNFRSIAHFVNCPSVGTFPWHPDTYDNYAHHNSIRIPATPGALGTFLSYAGCSEAALAPYVSNAKNNRFDFNSYQVPDLAGWYWLWTAGMLDWARFQAQGQEANGTVIL